MNRHKRSPSAEMGSRLFVRSSVSFDRLSACVRAAPYGRIYVKLYTGNFYANLSINYKLQLRFIVIGDIKLPLNPSFRMKWYQSVGTADEQLKKLLTVRKRPAAGR